VAHIPRGGHMFHRMSRLHFDEEQFDDLLAWAESAKP
jgi:hypothetical protein